MRLDKLFSEELDFSSIYDPISDPQPIILTYHRLIR